jgi:hypothetical protein
VLAEIRARIEAEPVDDSFGDLKIEAQETKVQTLALLDDRLQEARMHEAQQAQIAAERAALAEERRIAREESARQEAQMAAQRAELDRREAEAREADRKRLEAAWAAEQEASRERDAREAAAARAQARLADAAPAMLDILKDWSTAELPDADPELLGWARERRDEVIASLE